MNKANIDKILDSLESQDVPETSSDGKSIGFYMPLETKKKFEEIQRRDDRRFGKALKKVIIEMINRKFERYDEPPAA